MPEPHLVLDHVGVRDRGRWLLDGVSLALERGQTLALLGPPGAGKTALLLALAGFLPLAQGSIRLAGHDLAAVPPERRDIALAFAGDALFPHLSVIDNVAFGLKMRGVPRAERRARAAATLAALHIAALAERPPARLDAAERRLVALARACAAQPALLLIDEAASADAARGEAVLREVLAGGHVTAILATHDHAAAFGLADLVAVLHGGRLEQLGPPQRVYEQPASRFVAGFTGGCNLLPATLLHERNGEAVIEVAGATAAARCAPGLPAGRATLCIRPHRLALDPAGPVRGTVEHVAYRGAITLVTLRVGGATCMAETTQPVAGLTPGGTLAAGWDPARVWLIPADPA